MQWKIQGYILTLSGLSFFSITQKVFKLGISNFLAFLTLVPHLRLKPGLLHLLPEPSGILTKFLILPIPD